MFSNSVKKKKKLIYEKSMCSFEIKKTFKNKVATYKNSEKYMTSND